MDLLVEVCQIQGRGLKGNQKKLSYAMEDSCKGASVVAGKFNNLKLVKNVKSALYKIMLRHRSTERLFADYYKTNFWRDSDSKSGTGSNLKQTAELREALPGLFSKYGINSILDLPCGDFFWFSKIQINKNIVYTGADIVAGIVEDNNIKYGKDCFQFIQLDLTKGPLPTADLIITRDCLVHLSFKHIRLAIQNIKKSKSQYLLATHFTCRKANYDITTGGWRPLSLTLKPFNFPEPIEIIVEKCTEGDGIFEDKCMALWRIKDLL